MHTVIRASFSSPPGCPVDAPGWLHLYTFVFAHLLYRMTMHVLAECGDRGIWFYLEFLFHASLERGVALAVANINY